MRLMVRAMEIQDCFMILIFVNRYLIKGLIMTGLLIERNQSRISITNQTKRTKAMSKVRDYHRKKLIGLIQEVSSLCGGNANDFLNEYIAEVLNTWENDLVAAIAVFEDLKTQASKLASKDAKSDVTSKDGTFRGHAAFSWYLFCI